MHCKLHARPGIVILTLQITDHLIKADIDLFIIDDIYPIDI